MTQSYTPHQDCAHASEHCAVLRDALDKLSLEILMKGAELMSDESDITDAHRGTDRR